MNIAIKGDGLLISGTNGEGKTDLLINMCKRTKGIFISCEHTEAELIEKGLEGSNIWIIHTVPASFENLVELLNEFKSYFSEYSINIDNTTIYIDGLDLLFKDRLQVIRTELPLNVVASMTVKS